MYAIAFFATVILFSASLYVGHKFVDIATHFDDSDAVKELHINHAAQIGGYRQSAWGTTHRQHPKKVKMADNLGPMAWLLLPENVQVQYLQKIALRAENPSGPRYVKVEEDFLHEVQYF